MDGTVVVRYGLLRRVVGRAARQDGFDFVPAWFSFDVDPSATHSQRTAASPTHMLSDFIGSNPPPFIAAYRDEFGEPADAVWVRARIPAVFHFGPVSIIREERKYALIDHAFLACQPISDHHEWEAIPFVCVSKELNAGLAFSPNGPPIAIQQRIEKAFWNLLLAEPDRLSSYRDGYVSADGEGGDGWVSVDCSGERFVIDYEANEEPEEEDWRPDERANQSLK